MPTRERPNVVYVLTDDQRADLLGCAGHPVVETPNLDRLAEDGTRFENAFCTSPLCTPSRTSHYLGQWERRHGVNFNSDTAVHPEAWERSFPMRLAEAGYFTGWVGKNHVPVGDGGYESGDIEESLGYWYGNHNHSHFYPKEQARGDPEIYANASAETQAEVFEEGIEAFLRPEEDGATAFRESCSTPLPPRPTDRPFCLCVTFNLPHGAGTGSMQLRPSDPDRYTDRYRDRFDELPVPETFVGDWGPDAEKIPRHVYNGEWIHQYDYVKGTNSLRERMLRQCQTVSGIDRVIGRIRELLTELGEARNTIFVFSTDHGLMLGEHGLGGKGFLYEPAVNVPLIVYDPRAPESGRGRVRQELVAVPDLAPTVLDLADVDPPGTMQGRSLRPLLRGRDTDWRDELFLEQLFDNQHYPMSEAVRTREWKYVRYFDRTPTPGDGPPWGSLEPYGERLRATFADEDPAYEELYHLASDPHEEENVAYGSEHAGTLAEFRNRADRLAEQRYEGPPETVPVE